MSKDTSKRELQIIGDYLWDRAFARAVDRLSSEQFLIPAVVLMEAAGASEIWCLG